MLHVDVPEGCTSCGFYKLHTDSTSLTAKSSSPGLSERTFYACCTIELLHNKLNKCDLCQLIHEALLMKDIEPCFLVLI